MMTYSLNLENWGHYPQAENMLGRYIAEQSNGVYNEEHRKVFHNKKISKLKQEKIRAFSDALHRTQFGAP